jgi:hypothetical protein
MCRPVGPLPHQHDLCRGGHARQIEAYETDAVRHNRPLRIMIMSLYRHSTIHHSILTKSIRYKRYKTLSLFKLTINYDIMKIHGYFVNPPHLAQIKPMVLLR